MRKLYILVLLILVFLSFTSCGSRKKTTLVTIGTGSVTGVYYPTGGAISRMVNAHFDTYKIKATVESTIGSVSVKVATSEFGNCS